MLSRQRGPSVTVLLVFVVLAVLTAAGVDAAVAAAPTRARALAFARAVNLTAADVPGFTGSTSHQTAASKQFAAKAARCAGGVDPKRAVINRDSLDFMLNGGGGLAEQDVTSNVGVLSSSPLAARDLAAIRSARGRACLVAGANQLVQSMKVAGVKFGPVRASSAPHAAPGTNGSFGLRLAITATSHGLKIPFYIDALGFRLGPAEVSLTTLGILRPYPAADEQRLFALLAARATANRL